MSEPALPFVKLQGSGNDFVLIDGRACARDWPALAPAICDRHFGVGADGLLVAATSDRAPVRMLIYNPDGSEAEMCGNGLRCFVKWVVERGGLAAPDGALAVETGAGVLQATFEVDGSIEQVQVSMGAPVLRPAAVPVNVAGGGAGPVLDLPLRLDGETIELTCVSMGNPHAVQFTTVPVAEIPLERIGPLVERAPAFPNRTNFEVVNVIARDHLRVRVWERSAGLTLACGTGACAAQVAARLHGLVDERVTVSLPGGDVVIEWGGEGPVYLTGPAAYVFEGEWTPHGHA